MVILILLINALFQFPIFNAQILYEGNFDAKYFMKVILMPKYFK